MNQTILCAVTLIISVLSTACHTAPTPAAGPAAAPPQYAIKAEDIVVRPVAAKQEYECSLNIYSAVHALYAGMILPLELLDDMSLPAKYRMIEAVWSAAEASRSSSIEIEGYFQKADAPLCIITGLHSDCPPMLEWRSNAIYSPLTKGPLRGRGEFLTAEAHPMENISGTVMLLDAQAVRLCDLYSESRVEHLQAEKADLHLAQLYLYDGRRENDHLIQPLLDRHVRRKSASPNQTAAVKLIYTQYDLYRADYASAARRLRELREHRRELSPVLQRVVRFTYEEYCLCRVLDVQEKQYLIEYTQFTRGE